MIKFNEIFYTGYELTYIQEVMLTKKLQGTYDNNISEMLFKYKIRTQAAFLVHSCTAALEIAALALDIKPGDEVIMPSFTYVSTANAFVLRGAKIVFVDVDDKTMNINLFEVEKAINKRTRAIVPVHYGGVSCDMDVLMGLAKKYNVAIVEDAAQGIFSKYKDQYLGTIGDLGCISLHETKNITSGGEGGILFVNNKKLLKKINLIVEKGTNRFDFSKGDINKYTWQGLGSSYLMGQLGVAFFKGQLEYGPEITKKRIMLFNSYKIGLSSLINKEKIKILEIPTYNQANGHLFYIKTRSASERNQLSIFLKNKDIESASHYELLHNSVAGQKYGVFMGKDKVSTRDSKLLLRLPLHMHLSKSDIEEVVMAIKAFYEEDSL